MNITSEGNVINVEGSVVNFGDYDKFKSAMNLMIAQQSSGIVINFKDALTVNSALIGFLLKLKRADGIDFSIKTGNRRLYEMLDTLSLVEVLSVSKI